MTTWNSRCGIAGYSSQIVSELQKQGHSVTVLANRLWHDSIFPDEDFVYRCFDTGFTSQDKRVPFNVQETLNEISKESVDAFHLQYQSYLYPDTALIYQLLSRLKALNIRLVVTFHDSCIDPNFPFNLFDVRLFHGDTFKKVGERDYTIPIGIPEVDYVSLPKAGKVCSFGLGRNNNEMVKKVCDEIDMTFTFHDSQSNWLPLGGLIKFLQEHDVITLIYPDVDATVSSSAVKIALATKRPILVSDSRWFDDVRGYTIRVKNGNNLKAVLENIRTNEYNDSQNFCRRAEEAIARWGWSKVMKFYEEIYGNK